MNDKIRKFWQQEGEITGIRIGTRKDYRVDYFVSAVNVHKYIGTCYVSGENKQWHYIWNDNVVTEDKMLRITELKAFM